MNGRRHTIYCVVQNPAYRPPPLLISTADASATKQLSDSPGNGYIKAMHPERPYYYLFIDYITSIAIGLMATALAAYLIPSDWSHPVGMFVGMFLGMVAMLLAVLLFSNWSSGFNIMMPGMYTSMGAGMVSGMATVSGGMPVTLYILTGVLFGLSVQFAFHLYGRQIEGEVLSNNG